MARSSKPWNPQEVGHVSRHVMVCIYSQQLKPSGYRRTHRVQNSYETHYACELSEKVPRSQSVGYIK